jgi:hypothetical protein
MPFRAKTGVAELSQSVPTGVMPAIQNRPKHWVFVSELGLGVVLSLLLLFAARNLAWFAANFRQDALIPLILLSCYVLYVIRGKLRLAYSIVELGIGVVAILGVISKAPAVVPDEQAVELRMVQFLAGIYIVIRAFDNFTQSRVFAGSDGNQAREIFQGRWERKRKE